MSSIPLPTIDANGLTIPEFADILAGYKAEYVNIYGADIVLDDSTQDGQWVTVQATAYYDLCQVVQQVYNSRSPKTANYDANARNVALNGIKPQTAGYSTTKVNLDGTLNTVISNGQVEDSLGQTWNLPVSVTITAHPTVATVTAAVIGAVRAAQSTITKIKTPVLGWLSVINDIEDTSVGRAVETNAELVGRQAISTALPSQSILDGIVGAVANVPGVSAAGNPPALGWENDTETTDANGLPAHSIAIIVEGGDDTAIAEAIYNKKTPSVYTYGGDDPVEETITDARGLPHVIRFQRPTAKTVLVKLGIKSLGSYDSDTGDGIKAAVAAYIAGLNVGTLIYRTPIYPVAYLPAPLGSTYIITYIQLAFSPAAVGDNDLQLAYNEKPLCAASNVTITMV